MASSLSSSSGSWKYDVFLSFRGEDISKTFVDHLYSALQQYGIRTYKKDETLDRGDTISPALFSPIRESHIALVIFSENYIDSSWCLDELSYIMKCKEYMGQIVMPIFYHMDPSNVREQKRKYGEAFAKHELSENKKKKVECWKKAVVDARNIAGWEPKHVANGHEAEFIQEIVGSILDKLSSLDSVVEDEELVGMETRLEDLKSKLRIGSGGVRMVGIWGLGGGGKTTLATSLYMELKSSGQFHDCCFVENIREESKQHGLKGLQEKILSTVSKEKMQVESVELGKHEIKNMLCHRNVLIVLDDVDHLEQLEALAGDHNWFGNGSRIIITTRDEQVLESHRVDEENDKIDAIQCDVDGGSSNFNMLVSNMKNLKVWNTSFDEGPSFLSNELRYIDWDNYPASPFPESYQPMRLPVLKMEKSLQKELWKGYKFLQFLKVLQLHCANALVRTPDVGGLPCLEILTLTSCESLEEIHESLGNHSSLVHLSVSNCEKLTRFPTIVNMAKLENLEILGCKALYNVDPSDVRKQTGHFGKAFAKHKFSKNKNKVESWKKALVDASNISRWEPKIQAECNQEIIDPILGELSSLDSVVEDEKLVGMGSRLQQVTSHLGIGSGGVRMVGIWGVGGGGKTTLATSLYMEFSADFDGCCFVENVREESKQHGLKSLQEKIISAVFDKQMHVESVNIGKHKIKRMLCRRNVLIVLDNVDHLEQLEALAGSHSWFGNGSRIIITTRDEQVLKSHSVDEICPVTLLSDDEAIRLFKRHAYQAHNLGEDYEKLSLHVITYANGLPLALKILGSFLYGKDKDEWISTLARLKDQPEMGIVEKLKISYDGLTHVEKELFLDIACFHKGRSKDDAKEILDACGFYPAIGIKVLIQKALITVSKDGRFDMHDLVQEMGHYIVRGEHPYNPEKHSRVWQKEDIEDICSRNATMENDKIEAIQCYVGVRSSNFYMLVSNMKKLRFLNVITTPFDEGPTFLSNEFRYIDWEGHPASLFPESFQPRKLIVLKLKRSLQKELWKGYKYLPCLKEMELSYIKALVKTPDFGGLPCLQKLILKGCQSLEEIHQSLGNHSNLVYVSVSICDKLTRFPTIVKMDKLKILRMSECKALVEFPEIEASMDSLVELYLHEVGIQVLPPSVGEYCTNLISLKLEWCSKLKSIQGNFHALKCLEIFHANSYNLGSIEVNLPCSLTKLDLSWCKLKNGEITSEIGELSSLRELHLKGNTFSRLDFSLSRLTRLKLLDLRRCENLVELPELPSSLAILNADGCESLEIIKDDAHRRCKWLCDVSIRGDRKNITGGGRLLESMLQGKAVESGCMILQLKGLEIPRGFEPRVVRGRRCRLQVPDHWYNHFSGLLFCIVLDKYGDYFDLPKITTRMKHEKLTGDYSDLPKITTRMKHEKLTGDSMRMRDSQDDVYWNEADNDKYTCMIYISFGLLRNTSWWDQTSTAIQLEIDSLDDGYRVIGCGSKLVPKASETTITDFSFDDVSSDYTCRLKIRNDIFHVSESVFKFYIDYPLRPNLNVYLTTT